MNSVFIIAGGRAGPGRWYDTPRFQAANYICHFCIMQRIRR